MLVILVVRSVDATDEVVDVVFHDILWGCGFVIANHLLQIRHTSEQPKAIMYLPTPSLFPSSAWLMISCTHRNTKVASNGWQNFLKFKSFGKVQANMDILIITSRLFPIIKMNANEN
jgi:hypothetical protein